ncbi:hypothetical protein [Photobacterium damselae]|uniref:hypothetical protein n=1 Tax=Photobacterium damselae TaxID=38293 RepID=UPI001F388C0B|nr:hypothetical protein [Photobacterium damselae]UKA04872.1 hypothetical protein IHC89_21755 [Photobacterium damselae subsp. damselae]
MTNDDLIEYQDLINGTHGGKAFLPLSIIDNQSPRTLLVGYTNSNQMIHIYIHSTKFGNNYFSVYIHGNEAGGFQTYTHIVSSLTALDIRSYMIKSIFTDFIDLSFLKLLYSRLAHYQPKLTSFLDWFEKSCRDNGYPSQLGLYISEDILSAKQSGSIYVGTTCQN